MKMCPGCKGVCRDTDRICPSCGNEVTAENLVDGDALTGLRLTDKYELTAYIGEGAMGWVYRGIHLTLESSVAVKIMKPQTRPDEQRAERFKREARASSRLNHPHIISVIDFGETPSGLLYLVTEFLSGVSLAQMLAEDPVPEFKRTVQILSQILSALEESHNSGVIHRDLKPDNIMVTRLRGGEDFVKVLDFGIAKMRDDESQKLTQAGQLFGTPDYMAPEQIKGGEVTGTADLYAVGVILYQMVTGRLPFEAENFFDVLKDHLYSNPPRIAELCPDANYPDELQQVIDRAMAKNPASRFESASLFRKNIRQVSKLATGTVRRCPGCGELVEREVLFCSNCGHKVAESEPVPAQFEQPGGDAALDISHFGQVPLPTDVKPPTPPTRDSNPTMDRLWGSMSVSLPLVERPKERKEIDRLVKGEIKVLHLVGPAGIGKTSMTVLAREQAAQRGLAVVSVGPHPSLLPISRAPIREAVATVLGLPAGPSEAQLEHALAARKTLERDLAGLMALFDLEGPLMGAEPDVRNNEVIASASRVLTLGIDKPTLLIFDDVDLCDEPTRSFLTKLARRCEDTDLRLLSTSTMPLISETKIVKTAELTPLENDAVSAVVKELDPNSSDTWAGSVQKIIQTTSGNPLWLAQSLALATESGMESEAGLTDVMATRIKRLPGQTQQILQAVAVLGMESPVYSAMHLLGNTPPPL